MLMAGPRFNHARPVDQLIGQIDVAPTLIDAAGLAVPASMQGRSAMPFVERGAALAAGEHGADVLHAEIVPGPMYP
jgi:arylsulfatase A-like enzyme